MDYINISKPSKYDNNSLQQITYIQGDDVFSQHPRKLFRPELGVTYMDKSGCQLKKTEQDHPNLVGRRTMTRLQYSALQESSPNRNQLFNNLSMMRRTSFNHLSIGEISGSGEANNQNQQLKGSTAAKIGSFAEYLDHSYNQSIAQVNDNQNLNESEKWKNKVKEYHSKLYLTNSTRFSQNLMTSTSMTFSKRKGRKSTMQEWVQKDVSNLRGTKVINFRKGVPPFNKVYTPFEKINSEILNDAKWGNRLSGCGQEVTQTTKFPKYLPKIIKRDSLLLNKGIQTPIEIYGNRTHTRRMSGFTTNLKRLFNKHGKMNYNSIGEL